MKIWFPTIRAGTGADIFIINLAKGLRSFGVESEITWFPHMVELLPHTLRCAKIPDDIDIIHTNSWYGFAFSKIKIPKVVSVLHWVHDQSYIPYKSTLQKIYHDNLIKKYEYSSINNSTVVTAISEYTGKQVKNNFPNIDLRIVNTGIDTNLFKPKLIEKENDVFKLLFVGSPSRRKGFDLLKSIMDKLPNNIILHYTDGNLEPGQNIIKLGDLSLEQLIERYQESDALLFPSRYEGFGYVAAEAMACAKPVISSNNSAIPELVKNNETGLICPTDDTVSFVNSVLRLVEDKMLCEKLGNTARKEIMERFNVEDMIKKYINIYKSII